MKILNSIKKVVKYVSIVTLLLSWVSKLCEAFPSSELDEKIKELDK